jgi:hypothetical protein
VNKQPGVLHRINLYNMAGQRVHGTGKFSILGGSATGIDFS